MVYGETIYDDIELRSSEVALVQEALTDFENKLWGELEQQDNPWGAGTLEHDIRKTKQVREKLREITGGQQYGNRSRKSE